MGDVAKRIVLVDAPYSKPLADQYALEFDPRHDVHNTRGMAPLPKDDGLLVGSAITADDLLPGEHADLYTAALARLLGTPGLEMRALLDRVDGDVREASNNQQKPIFSAPASWTDFDFVPPKTDEEVWTEIKTSHDAAVFIDFMQRFPRSKYKATASERAKALALVAAKDQAAHDQAARDQASKEQAAKAQEHHVGQMFKDCDLCPELIVVPHGTFQMGTSIEDVDDGRGASNEQPQHTAVVEKPFAVGKSDVTIAEYEHFVKASYYRPVSECFTMESNNPKKRPDRSFLSLGYSVSGEHPAVCVSWSDAMAYVNWIGKLAGHPYRLLSELERVRISEM